MAGDNEDDEVSTLASDGDDKVKSEGDGDEWRNSNDDAATAQEHGDFLPRWRPCSGPLVVL